MPDGGPTGPVTVAVGQFTHCVDKAHYSNPTSFGLDAGLGTLGKDACDYLLGRKLICLDGVKCAIGTIVFIEPVGYDKPFPEDIDNDFCINLLLHPHEVDEFSGDKLKNWEKVTGDGVQGGLVLPPKDMPAPKEPAADPTPYTVTYLFGVPGVPKPYEHKEDKTERLLEEIKQDASGVKRIEIPVLHCEFEGSRIFMVCEAISPFLDLATGGPGAGACRAAIGWIPLVGDLVCTIVETAVTIALAPLMALAAASAWASAGVIDELAVTGPIARRVSLGDHVIVTGRWAWDGGHSGWNEFHPTITLQQIVLPESTGTADAKAFVDTWCGLVAQAPPRTGETGQPLGTMTPAQKVTHDRQQQAEHRWTFHPAIDGCLPAHDHTPRPAPGNGLH